MLFLQEGTGTSSRRNPFISNVRRRLLVLSGLFFVCACVLAFACALACVLAFDGQSTDEVSLLTLHVAGRFHIPTTYVDYVIHLLRS